MLRFTVVRVAVLLTMTAASVASAQDAAKVKPQGGMMSAAASKAKAHKMSTAEIIRSATPAGPRSISDNATVMAAASHRHAPVAGATSEKIGQLENDIAELRAELAAFRLAFDEFRKQFE